MLLLIGSGMCALSASAAGQQGTPKPPPAPPTKSEAAPPPQVVMPGAEKLVTLIRTAVLTLNDAVQTGNFTVLRDTAAPGFREANTAARLSQVFSNLAQQHIDLSSIAVIAPQLAETPVIDPKTSMLRIKGWFPTQPMQINFVLVFQPVGGRWRVFGISVNATAPTAPPQSPDGAPAAPQKEPNSAKSDVRRKSP